MTKKLGTLRAHKFFENLLQKFYTFHQSPMHHSITVQVVYFEMPRQPNAVNEFFFKGRGMLSRKEKTAMFSKLLKCPSKWGSHDKSTVPRQSKEHALETFLSSSLHTPIFAAPMTQINAL